MASKKNSHIPLKIIQKVAETYGLKSNCELIDPTEPEIDFLNNNSCGCSKRLSDGAILFLRADHIAGHLMLIKIREKTKEELSKERHLEKIVVLASATVYPSI